MRISYLVHGFPPRENAGTEQHTASLVAKMKDRGHRVQVISATRAPGRHHAEIMKTAENCNHIVNNIPARPLKNKECDGHIRVKINQLLDQFQPELIHVQHVQFLSADLKFCVPTVFTFHDAWAWCAAGGIELRWPSRENCDSPSAEDCAKCSALWHPQISMNAHRLIGFAERLQSVVPTELLHKLWQKLPNRIRLPFATERGTAAPAPQFADARNEMLKAFVNQCDIRLAPSRYLAERAMQNGIAETQHLPHGVDDRYAHVGGKGVLFLGTLSFHKGADLVLKAVAMAFPDGSVPAHFYGFPVDPDLAAKVNAKPPLERSDVWQALRHADVLVMGSRWRENSPLVILEAKASGCPIIAPRIGGIPELIIEGQDGFLYTPGSIEDCAKALLKWKNSPRLIPNPPPSATKRVDKLEDIYKELLRQ